MKKYIMWFILMMSPNKLKHIRIERIKSTLLYMLLLIVFQAGIVKGQPSSEDIGYFQIGFSANVFSEVNINDATASAKVLTEFFLKQYGRDYYKVKPPATFKNTDELRNIITEQEFEVLVMHPSEFILVRNLDMLEPIAVAWRNGSPFDSFYLLVHKDSKYKQFIDLRDKSLLICSLEGNKTELWLNHLLKQNNIGSKDNFFSKLEYIDKPLSTILPVFFKKTDACVIDKSLFETVCELNPQINSELIAIETSEPLAIKIVTIRKSISDLQEKADLKEAFFDMHTYEEARQYLTVFRIGKVIEFKEEYLSSTYDIMSLKK